MNNKHFLLTTLGLCIACPLSAAQTMSHDGLIEFCSSLSDSSSNGNFDIAVNGNLYVLPNSLDGSHFTTIKYYGNSAPSVFTTFSPSVFSSNGLTGSVAFAGDTLIYVDSLSRSSPDLNTVVLQLYDLDVPSGDLTESDTIYMPTLSHRAPLQRPALSAEIGQFAVDASYPSGTSSYTSRVNVYREDLAGWTLDGSIESLTSTTVRSIAIKNNTLIIGYDNNTVHLYERDLIAGWQFTQIITQNTDDIVQSSDFGKNISISDNLIAISDPTALVFDPSNNSNAYNGAVSIYNYTNGVVSFQETVIENDGSLFSSGALFGSSLDFSDDGNALLVCANSFDIVANDFDQPGAVFVYKTNDFSTYDQIFYDGNYLQNGASVYGKAARFSGNTLSVYTSAFTGGNCSLRTPAFLIYENANSIQPCSLADFDPDGVLSFFDISVFLVAFNASDIAADLNDDGFLNFFDITLFLQIFADGCP